MNEIFEISVTFARRNKSKTDNEMEITNAEFVISNTDVRKCPGGTFPEYAS